MFFRGKVSSKEIIFLNFNKKKLKYEQKFYSSTNVESLNLICSVPFFYIYNYYIIHPSLPIWLCLASVISVQSFKINYIFSYHVLKARIVNSCSVSFRSFYDLPRVYKGGGEVYQVC